MLEIAKTLNDAILASTSSGQGNGFYAKCASCGMFAHLNELEAGPPDHKQAIGIGFHELMRLHNTGNAPYEVTVEVSDGACGDLTGCVVEALRLYAAYRHFFPEDWGTIVAVEEHMMLASELGEELLGVPDFTARLDLVQHLNAAQVARLQKECPELALWDLQPGYYIWDYKTASARDNNAALKDQLNTAAVAYPVVWKAQNPDKPVQGSIFDHVVRHTKLRYVPGGSGKPREPNSFYKTFVPAPSQEDIAELKQYYRWARDQYLLKQRNLSNCGRFSPCPYNAKNGNGLCREES